MSTPNIMYRQDGREIGPVTREALDALIAKGELVPEALIRFPPSNDWITVKAYCAQWVPLVLPNSGRHHKSRTAVRDVVICLVVAVVMAAMSISSFTRARKRALTGLGEYRQIDAAKEQYSLENSITNNITPAWADLTPYMKAGSDFVRRGGKDRIGNQIIIGRLHEPVRVNPKTKEYLKDATGGDTFWGPYS